MTRVLFYTALLSILLTVWICADCWYVDDGREMYNEELECKIKDLTSSKRTLSFQRYDSVIRFPIIGKKYDLSNVQVGDGGAGMTIRTKLNPVVSQTNGVYFIKFYKQ